MPEPAFRPTDFFRRQDSARRRTRLLVLWFIAGITGTTLAVYAAAKLCFGIIAARPRGGMTHVELWDPKMFLICTGVTLLIVGGASAFKTLSLSGGGGRVAESLGGRRVDSDTSDPDERRLINVVEEMSLASGVPMPEVYLLDGEDGINAFAAGDSIENAAVAVTRGALRKLTRDELQAVMGHEFSHILNGDMRLNLRLIGWIAGLVAITVIGRIVFEIGGYGGGGRDRKSNAAFFIFGLLLLGIGLIGNLFAQMIQAAISREREHLADASATQFTRNPQALADALRRIGGDAAGSRLDNAHASEIAHMCFGEGVSALFASHPPLPERIRLLDAEWDGTYLPPAMPSERAGRAETEARRMRAETDAATSAFAGATPTDAPTGPARPFPSAIANLIRTPLGAQTAVILILMTDNPADNRRQAEIVRRIASRELYENLKSAWGATGTLSARDRIAVVQQAAPALRRLSQTEAASLLQILREIADADSRVSFFEIALIQTVSTLVNPGDDRATGADTAALARALRLTLGTLLLAGVDDHDHDDAYARAARLAPGYGHLGAAPTADELHSGALESALATLAGADFTRRGEALAAAECIVRHDGVVNEAEADLLRALATALRCPTSLV